MAISGNTSIFDLISAEKRALLERLVVHMTGPNDSNWEKWVKRLLASEDENLALDRLVESMEGQGTWPV